MATILLDCDGVICDFAGSVLRLVTHGRLKLEDVTSWDIFSFLTETENEAAHMLLSGPEFWLNLPVIPGASRFVRLARERGHRVVFVTSPWIPCTEWESSRRTWLIKHMDADPGDIVFTSAKELVGGDVFIDDRVENVCRWADANRPATRTRLLRGGPRVSVIEFGALLMSAPYNADVADLRRFTWESPDSSMVDTDYVLNYLDAMK